MEDHAHIVSRVRKMREERNFYAHEYAAVLSK